MMKTNKNILKFFLIFIITMSLFSYPLIFSNVYGQTYTHSSYNDACSSSGYNVKGSLILSVISLCLPGILEKVQEYRQIQCQEVVCYYNSVKNGLNPAYCSQIKAYQTCKYIVGEAFAITGLNILDNLKQKIANIIANPIGIAYSIAVNVARNFILKSVKNSIIVGTASTFIAVTDIASVIETFKNIKTNGFVNYKQTDYCSKLPKIEKEMQTIIKANK